MGVVIVQVPGDISPPVLDPSQLSTEIRFNILFCGNRNIIYFPIIKDFFSEGGGLLKGVFNHVRKIYFYLREGVNKKKTIVCILIL